MFLQLAFEVISTTRDTKLARVYLKNAMLVAGPKQRMAILKAFDAIKQMEEI